MFFFAFLVSVVQLGNQILLGGKWSTAKTAGRFTNGSGWWAKLVCQGDFTTIFIVNMETQWNIWNLDEIVNGLGMALVNWCQLWNGEGYQWNLRCTCWTGRMVSSKSLIGDRQGCRRLPWHPWCELYSKFVTHWYGQNLTEIIELKSMIWFAWCTDMHWYMFPGAKWIQMALNSQPTFYTGLQSCVRHLCWWIAKRPLMQWPPMWSTGPCNKRSSTWIKGAMLFGRRMTWTYVDIRRWVVWFVWRVLQMTSSTLAFLRARHRMLKEIAQRAGARHWACKAGPW